MFCSRPPGSSKMALFENGPHFQTTRSKGFVLIYCPMWLTIQRSQVIFANVLYKLLPLLSKDKVLMTSAKTEDRSELGPKSFLKSWLQNYRVSHPSLMSLVAHWFGRVKFWILVLIFSSAPAWRSNSEYSKFDSSKWMSHQGLKLSWCWEKGEKNALKTLSSYFNLHSFVTNSVPIH